MKEIHQKLNKVNELVCGAIDAIEAAKKILFDIQKTGGYLNATDGNQEKAALLEEWCYECYKFMASGSLNYPSPTDRLAHICAEPLGKARYMFQQLEEPHIYTIPLEKYSQKRGNKNEDY